MNKNNKKSKIYLLIDKKWYNLKNNFIKWINSLLHILNLFIKKVLSGETLGYFMNGYCITQNYQSILEI